MKRAASILLNGILFLWFLALFLFPLMRISNKVSIDYNEGWNGLFASMVSSGENCYQSLESTILNNYPPLFFYINHFFTKITGDHILSGRILSLTGLLLTALFMYLILRRHGKASLSLALIYLIYQLNWHLDYVGTCIPQWLAHGVMLAGFWLFMNFKRNNVNLLICLAAFTIAGLIKHSLVPLPVAITLWMILKKEKGLKCWLLGASAASFFVFTLLKFTHAPYLWESIFNAPRLYRITLISRLGIWLIPSVAALAVLFTHLDLKNYSKNQLLFLIYLTVSFLWALFTSGGGGVYYNCLFDFEIALFLIIGSLFAVSTAIYFRSIFILTLPVLFNFPFQLYVCKEGIANMESDEKKMEDDISFISRFPEPVFCENLLLTYWAGKEYRFDSYTIDQKIKSGFWSEKQAIKIIRSLSPSIIQLNSIDETSILDSGFREEILKYYEPIRSSDYGYFLIPRK